MAARSGDWQRVLAAARSGLAVRPGRADLHFAEARALRHLGRPAAAAATATQGLASRPYDYLGLVELGRSLRSAGDATAALDALDRAQSLHPRWPQAHAAAGRLHFELGDLAEAEQALASAVTLEDEPAPRVRSLLLLCELRRRDDRPCGALSELETALAVGLPPGLEARARELLAAGRAAFEPSAGGRPTPAASAPSR